jgi:methylmalonyl-CoA mutase N-terminal domain/subunit
MSVVEQRVPPADLLEQIRQKERELESLRSGLAAWEGAYERAAKRDDSFTSVSGVEVEPLYTPLDRPEPSPEEARYYNEKVGLPGEFPFTRGPYGTMYRTRFWTMRQFAGFGTAEETNERYHFLLQRGQTGLSWPSTSPP